VGHVLQLESLALARAAGDIGLEQLLLEVSRRFGRHTTVVVVTPSPDEGWAMTLMSLAGRGVKVAAVLLEAETWGGSRSSLDVYGTLAAAGLHHRHARTTPARPGGRGELVTADAAP
jgi:hypothetical protein